jgi:glycosyltransferase involved in cell wall biosynthesis
MKLLRYLHDTKKRFRAASYPVVLNPSVKRGKPVGRVLFSYLEHALLLDENAPEMRGHSNLWESQAIAKIFQEMGFQVEAVSWSDRKFTPTKSYDVVFDIFSNLARWAPLYGSRTIKLLHCTGSDPYYQNAAETQRVASVNQRRNGDYKPKRILAEPEWTYRSLDVADACSLIGNEHTRSTYPEKYLPKMELVTVSASATGATIKKFDDFVPPAREFLWFFGGGAVHKGLDLLLEVFSRHPHLVLHVVGNVKAESDFFQMYENELTRTKTIHYHGALYPSSWEFQNILKNTFCFIAPTCSEGISPAVVTCLQLGLYPIVSRDTGIILPDNCGMYLETCTLEEIEGAVLNIYKAPETVLSPQIRKIQRTALQRYSREAFRDGMKNYITVALARAGKLDPKPEKNTV